MKRQTGMMTALAAIALTGCSPIAADAGQPAASAAAQHPESGLEIIPLFIESKRKRHAFRVEVARSDAEWAKGLMFRTAMGANDGMIFVGRPPQPASFWMKNTVIPLDIVFIGTDNRILNIGANAVPYALDPVASTGPVIAVLELNGGRAAALGIGPGDKVAW